MFSPNKQPSLSDIKPTRLTLALAAIWCASLATSTFAMESMDDQALSNTTGADGIAVNAQATGATFSNLYWQDGTSGNGNVLALQNATLSGNGTSNFTANATIQAGTTSTNVPALNMNLNLSAIQLTAPQIVLCTGMSAASVGTPGAPTGCGTSMGQLTFQTINPTTASLVTTNGLLNSAGSATVKLLLNNANIYFTSNGNQLITSDIYANISASGRIWVDAADGFRFSTAGATNTPSGFNAGVSLTAPGSWGPNLPINAGLQASLVMKNGTAISTTGPSSPNGLITIGASGNIPTLNAYLRGTSASGTEDNLGSVVGSAGIVARLNGNIQTGTGAGGFQVFLGAAGTGGYGIQMSNFVPFSNVTSTAVNPFFDSGNVYMNLIGASTTSLIMPISSALTNNKGAGNLTSIANNFNLPTSDATNGYDTQTIPGNNSLLLAVRGLTIQGVPLQTTFYQNFYGLCTGTTTCSGSGAISGFAIMPVLYGVNANLTLNPNTATALGYSLALSMSGNNGGTEGTGSGASGTAGTLQESALFLADTSSSTPQYIGLRDINLYLKANGVITFGGTASSNSINITLPNFLLAMSANFAAGYLPGADILAGVPAANQFTSNKDTLFTINLGLKSDSTLTANNNITISTSSSTASTLGLTADLTLAGTAGTCSNTNLGCSGGTVTAGVPTQANATSNFFRIIDNSGSALGLDNITGRIALGTGSQISVGSNNLTVTSNLQINPQNIKGNELLATLNFYNNPASGSQTTSSIGNMVITGSTILSNITLSPVSH